MVSLDCLSAVALFYAAVTVTVVVLPAWTVTGYACGWDGRPLRYRLNGPLCLAAVCVAWWVLPSAYQTFAATHYGQCLAAANVIGLVAALALLVFTSLEPSFRCLTVDQKALCALAANGEDVSAALTPAPPRNVLQHFFFGVAFNPRLWGIDLKMLLYALGAAALAWNLMSAAALRAEAYGHLSLALRVYLGMFGWFIFEYMCLEIIHLYTYDLFCEKLGFKLCWGCLVFYPFFYCIGVWSLVAAPAGSDISAGTALLILLLFGTGWVLTRGANTQKFVSKRRDPECVGTNWLGLVPMTTVPGSQLLCQGFWGISRHVNYLGEVLQAIALALPGFLVAGGEHATYYAVLPWLYPLYYVALFIPRQMDDDAQLQAKYGAAIFAEYVRRVPWRIVPGIW